MGLFQIERGFERIVRAGQTAFRKELIAHSEVLARRLQGAYQHVLAAVEEELAAFQNSLSQENQLTGATAHSRELLALQYELRRELERFAQDLQKQSELAEVNGLKQGMLFGGEMLDAINVQWARPSPAVLEELVKITDSMAFAQYIDAFPDLHSDRLGDILLAHMAQGKSPLRAASDIVRYVENYPLLDAQRLARTTMLYAARRGTAEMYRQHSDIVRGWRWSSALDKRTCPSCLAQHGKVFALGELLNDHYNGRCAMVPVTSANVDMPVRSGEDWFDDQPEAVQRSMLGNARWEAWKAGEFTFSQLSAEHLDPVFGIMRYAPSLRQLRFGA